MKSNPLAKFVIKPGKWNPYLRDARSYYHVYVFETKQDMWAAGKRLSVYEKDADGGYGAITIPDYRYLFTKTGEMAVAPKVGSVLFYKGLLGSECICHESVHLATSYLRIFDKLNLGDQIDEHEEALAYCVGSCARQIVDKLYELGIL